MFALMSPGITNIGVEGQFAINLDLLSEPKKPTLFTLCLPDVICSPL